jgi:diaminopimelate epimerase
MNQVFNSDQSTIGLPFHKMHGAGNDFVLLDCRNDASPPRDELIRHITDRKRGIGCDQVLILRPAQHGQSLLRYEIRNTDGSPADQCGNGARCIALYLQMNGEIEDQAVLLESPSGMVEILACQDGEFEVDMGEPSFDPNSIPICLDPKGQEYSLTSSFGLLNFAAVSMGNPHALIEVEDITNAPLDSIGQYLCHNEVFPEGCNVGFAQVTDRDNIHLHVFERGVGQTLACGSGACAAVAILRRADRVNEVVNVFQPGGHLVIKWAGLGHSVKMKGSAAYVFGGMLHE